MAEIKGRATSGIRLGTSATATVKKGAKVRMNVTFSPKYYEILEELSLESGSTKADVIRNALAFQDWVHELHRQGGRLIVERKNGERAEVLIGP